MLRVRTRRIELPKLFPLAISRGAVARSENLFVWISDGEFEGLGEHSPATGSPWTAERGEAQIAGFEPLESPWANWAAMREAGLDPPAMAAVDTALWDLLAKRAGLPLHRLLGLPKTASPTSVTIGLNPPEVDRERVPAILRLTGAKHLKIKLGSPEGLDYDRAHFLAAAEAARPFRVGLRVDANGGWTVDGALAMMAWLAERGVDYVEQPLPEGQEADLPRLFAGRPLPIFVDESCRFSQDVPKWAASVDGVNVKLMKCGGITEAVRIVATARAHGLATMIGCMSDTSVGIAAAAAIGALFDHLDLDSHLNLDPDPADGAPIVDGVVAPTDRPGHGASLLS